MLVVLGLTLGSFVNALVWRLHAQEEIKRQIFDASTAEEKDSDSAGKHASSKAAAVKAKKLKAIETHKLQSQLQALSMTKGRSMCSKCRHPLAPLDLVPLFSWLFLAGKCRYCRLPIEDPPLVELVLPVLFVLSYVFWPLPLTGSSEGLSGGYGLFALGLWLVFLVGFMALSVYDIRWFLLPDKIVWQLVSLAVGQVAFHAAVFGGGMPVVVTAIWGVAVGSGVFYVIYSIAERLNREWIGFGDVKLGIVLGLLVGGPLDAAILLYIASLLGLAASLPLVLGLLGPRNKLKRTSLIPYGPFLMAACVVVVLAGPNISNWLDGVLRV